MNIDHLVNMANRIAEFFEAMTDHAEACEGVAQHLQRYWEPRMREALREHVQTEGGTGLRPLVLEAVRDRMPLSAAGAA